MRLRELNAKFAQALREHGIESPMLEASLILSTALNLSRTQLISRDEEQIPKQLYNKAFKMLKRRLEGCPLAYILGHKEFWSLDLKVTEDTLVPRPETELLVETALLIPNKNRVLDLGTGTGAVILAIKKESPSSSCVAVDNDPKTLQTATYNAKANDLEIDFRLGSWYEAVKEGELFDLIVSNPPYISPLDPHLQKNGLNFEPYHALVSDDNGFADLKTVISGAPLYLKEGGSLMTEHGFNQGEAVRELFGAAGFSKIVTLKDFGGNERVTKGLFL